MIVLVLTALAGGLGAAARFALDMLLAGRLQGSGARLMVVNLSGSALLGLLTGLAVDGLLGPELPLVLGAGFLGGYTTSVQPAWPPSDWSRSGVGPSRVVSLGMLLGSVTTAALGLTVGLAI